MAAADESGGWREVPFAALHDDNNAKSFVGNTVKTSKYTVVTFLPLNLWEQLQKAANAYFLGISMLMFIGKSSGLFATSVQAITTLGPLVLMMSASAVLAWVDDYRRKQADLRMNKQRARAIRMGGKHGVYLDVVSWENIKVGDILVVKGDDDMPADMIPLASSGGDGVCYVSTANLDGETNLKIKTAAPAAQRVLCEEEGKSTGDAAPPLLNQAVDRLASFRATINAERPSKSIHSFTGSLSILSEGEGEGPAATHALGPDNLLLRGTQLKNTAWCFGVVVYTGQDTRMAKNSSKTPMKLANLERVVNRAMLIVLGTQALLALLSDIMYCMSVSTFQTYWYLYPQGSGTVSILLPDWVGYWFTFFILYCNLMPISLYAAMEVCNFAQAFFIKSDLEMYDESQDCPALVRSTNLCHELGQVSYVFSDKTGTLTQNVMELKRISVANSLFGTAIDGARGFNGAPDLQRARNADRAAAEAMDAFLEILSVSHTVMVSEDQRGEVKFEAESPDEGALVEAASALGWKFRSRAGQKMTVGVCRDIEAAASDTAAESSYSPADYVVLAVNTFTSARKRMSVVVKSPTGELWVLVKGADNVMLDRAASSDPALPGHLSELAKEGLRTLVLGRRKIEESEFAAWRTVFEEAQTALTDREGRLAEAAEKLEVNLQIVGATGIEDKLQDGVGETIVRLRKAGIKLWVLTGDKLETARNIGYSTKVLCDEMEVMVMDAGPNEGEEALRCEMNKMLASIESADAEQREAAMMVTGSSLEQIADNDLAEPFLQVATRCKVIIACRVSPLQKAWMVKLVRTGISPQPVTLSIGDGANDVPMIQEAQVGVGISGREGRQAVNAADFAIAQFQFLNRLLLVHGRLNYRRMCKFILYSFWKNAVLTLLLFYYTFISGFSGTSMFDGMIWTSFNVILFCPIIATGVFDRDVEDRQAIENPKLYETGRLGLDLNASRMLEMLLSSLVHSLILFMIMMLAFDKMDTVHANDYYSFGTTVFTWLVFAMNYRVIFVTTTINWVFVGAVASSVLLYIFFMGVYCRWEWLSPWMYNVDIHMVQEPLFWIGLLAVPALAAMVDSFKAFLILEFIPDRRGLVLERVSLKETRTKQELTKRQRDAKSAQSIGGLGDGALQSCPEDGAPNLARFRARSRSAFDFDHPEVGHRHLTFDRNPTAGDTSLVDQHISDTHAPSEPSERPDLEAGNSAPSTRRPRESKFAQQNMPFWKNSVTPRSILTASVGTGVLLLALGVLVLTSSSSVGQFVIHYDGTFRRPLDSAVDEVFHRPCPVPADGGAYNFCEFNVEVPSDMAPPIVVFYEITPFYQNFYDYQTSVVFDQLRGEEMEEDELEEYCEREPTRMTSDGKSIDPCGLIATSVFNDTIDFVQAPVDDDDPGMTWESDYDRFDNPPDYLNRENVSWLYERYPTVTDKERGVKSRRFVDWMFTSFFGHVRNMYGYIHEPLTKGQNLTVRVNASFPVESLGAEKRIIVSTRNSMGGRHTMLGYVLIVSSIACFLMAVSVCMIQRFCPRRVGRARFPLLAPRQSSSASEMDDNSTDASCRTPVASPLSGREQSSRSASDAAFAQAGARVHDDGAVVAPQAASRLSPKAGSSGALGSGGIIDARTEAVRFALGEKLTTL